MAQDMRKYQNVASRIRKAIMNQKFNYENYLNINIYYGVKVMTQPMFCSYGQIGYEVYIYDENDTHIITISYDWEMGRVREDHHNMFSM